MEALLEILRQYWGYDAFRPRQAEAMRAVVEGRDSVVVLPTGGGKSLCFQAPAMQMRGLAVVVSPLISLMKDQVDALVDNGVPAACVNSSLTFDEKRRVADEIRSGRLKLLYLSPERLMTDRTLDFLQGVPVSFFAIDEAHCISEWGHDFRPEYRALRRLKERFPNVALHAYTATATEHVRDDIARELRLANPDVLVGSFDRSNLVYRVQRRADLLRQVREVVQRHAEESGIIYCIRRKDTEELAAALTELGHAARAYHAGMSDMERKQNQEAFINDRAKIIVATVAFGMGIDKSDVRYVIHAAAPKSLEAYQQESGRAGRDGLEAECWLFWSGSDFQAWRRLQRELPPHAYEIAMTVLSGIENYCLAVGCRHRAIVRYFGQELEAANCGACDVCMAEVDLVTDSLVLSQKILSCVARLNEKFGVTYTLRVLIGSRDRRIIANGHDSLSTYGLLSEYDRSSIRIWIEQLVNQQYVSKAGEYEVLQLTAQGRRVLRGEVTPRLTTPPLKTRRESRVAVASWEGVDRELFDVLRAFRRRRADEHGVPPFIIFSDATLRDLARVRPSMMAGLMSVHGIGEKKAAEYGDELLREISAYCREAGIETDVPTQTAAIEHRKRLSRIHGGSFMSKAKNRAFELFAQGESLDAIVKAVDRAPSTIVQYLVEFIQQEAVRDPAHWVDAETFERIRAAAGAAGQERLKPIFDALGGEVSYDQIRIALACIGNEAPGCEKSKESHLV
jgi:ATP-dependent DNA helicase RecQ